MAIDINRVYETVQSIINIEQRGQLPAKDFNRIASLAQLDLLNRLFYDEPYFKNHPKGGEGSFVHRNIEDMQDVFATEMDIERGGPNRFVLPDNLYRLEAVYYDVEGDGDRTDFILVEKMNHRDYSYVERSPLTQPTETFPKYLRFEATGSGSSTVDVLPRSIETIHIDYIRTPVEPLWDSFTVGSGTGTPLYNASTSQDFDLHPAMEQDLILRILYYAGVSVRAEEISQFIGQLASQDEQIEKS